MEVSRQTLTPAAIDPQPRPADREIYIKPPPSAHRERPAHTHSPTTKGEGVFP